MSTDLTNELTAGMSEADMATSRQFRFTLADVIELRQLVHEARELHLARFDEDAARRASAWEALLTVWAATMRRDVMPPALPTGTCQCGAHELRYGQLVEPRVEHVGRVGAPATKVVPWRHTVAQCNAVAEWKP